MLSTQQLIDPVALEKTLLASNYAQLVMQQLPEQWQHDYAQDQYLQPLTSEYIQQLVQQELAGKQDEYSWMKALRQLRARLMLRWIWQDANQLTNVVDLTRELADFADACIEQAVGFARKPLIEKYGEPIGDDGKVQDLIVIGMGKLGARELNLSSDIDLIFAFDEPGETNGKRQIDNLQFFVQWGQAVIRLLDQVTADGFVFRVDMRLRPWGDGSALALSHNALERYLAQHGREWERYAWIKARAITGGAAGEYLLKMTQPFVYRRYVDYSAFAAMREMKAMIVREVQRRNTKDDVKLGDGGIREIEFIVQVFQLIYGGSRKELQVRNCLLALQALGRHGLINQQDVDALHTAYLFLRRVEHAIQALDDQQTQLLPQQAASQQRIAHILGFADWTAFSEELEQVRQVVSTQFAALISERINVEPSSDGQQDLTGQLENRLSDDAKQQLQAFWQGNALKKLPDTARQRLDMLWPRLLDVLLKKPDVETPLLRLIPLIESILRRSVYLVMLIENQGALHRLVDIVATSPWISQELTHYPVLLDEFLSTNFELPTKADLQDNLRQQLLRVELDDIEEQMRVLRLFKKSQVLAVAASDVLAERPLMKVSDALTDIAEVVVQAGLQLAINIVAARHGFPRRKNADLLTAEHPAFAVIGYGKLGGIELGYGSDLDLVFVHEVEEQSETEGKKSVSGMEFGVRVAQKLMALLTTQTLDGRAYEVDMRLRPSGDAGVLVSSINAFESYQKKSAWLWEHQALVRARSIAGDVALCQQFEQIRRAILTQPRDPAEVQTEVKNMRQKMKDHLGSSAEQQKAGIFHLKQDAGGIVDIEFMAQYAVLAWSGTNPDLARFSDNVRILDDAATAGCLSRSDADALTQAYLRERTESHRLALAQRSMQVNAADWHDTRKVVCNLWQQLIDPATGLLDD